MTPRPWHTGEIRALRAWSHLGATVLADLLDRSPSAIEHKARDLGISLVPTGADAELSQVGAWILERIRESSTLEVCPVCGVRLAVVKKTGVCRVCHLEQLIAIRESQLLEQVRERKLVKLRQDKRRLKVCHVCGRPFFPRVGSTALICQDCDGVA